MRGLFGRRARIANASSTPSAKAVPLLEAQTDVHDAELIETPVTKTLTISLDSALVRKLYLHCAEVGATVDEVVDRYIRVGLSAQTGEGAGANDNARPLN